jgi:hypothetical protein
MLIGLFVWLRRPQLQLKQNFCTLFSSTYPIIDSKKTTNKCHILLKINFLYKKTHGRL